MDTKASRSAIRYPVASLVAVVVLVGLLAQWALGKPYYVGILNDDACYILRAYDISGGGRCLVCRQALTEGRAYQPGWPLLVAPLSYLAGGQLWAYRALSLLLTLISATALGRVARRYFGFPTAALAASALLFSGGALWLGSSTMSEPFFVCLICALLVLAYSERPPEKTAWMVGVLAGWCAITRTEGLAIPVALVLCYGIGKRWRPAVTVLGVAVAFKLAMAVLMPAQSPHLAHATHILSSVSSFWDYLARWISQQSRMLSECFLGSPALPWTCLSLALTALAMWGLWKWWRRNAGFAPLLGLVLPVVLFVWPYPHLRYWYALLPLWILGLAFALPGRARLGGLALIVALQVFNARVPQTANIEAVVALYTALRQVPQNAVVTCVNNCRVHLYSHRATVVPAQANSLAELVAFMVTGGSEYVLWETNHSLMGDVYGAHQANFLPVLPLWIESSPLFEVVARTPAGLVAKLRYPGPEVGQAFSLYRQAFMVADDGERLRLLEQCQALVPDFPGAAMLWAQAAFATPDADRGKIREVLIAHAERYPFDFASTFTALSMLPQLGDVEAARLVAERSLIQASRLGLTAEASALSNYLASLSSRDAVRLDKGGPQRGDERPAP